MKASASGAVGSPSPGIFNLGEKHRGSQKAKMLAKISTPHKRYEKKVRMFVFVFVSFYPSWAFCPVLSCFCSSVPSCSSAQLNHALRRVGVDFFAQEMVWALECVPPAALR